MALLGLAATLLACHRSYAQRSALQALLVFEARGKVVRRVYRICAHHIERGIRFAGGWRGFDQHDDLRFRARLEQGLLTCTLRSGATRTCSRMAMDMASSLGTSLSL